MKNQLDSSIQIENFMENGREISISDFGFRSTFNEGSVGPGRGKRASWTPHSCSGSKISFKGLLKAFKRPLKGLVKAFKKPFKGLSKAVKRPLKGL